MSDTTNSSDQKHSERIANMIVRVFAIIGLVSILALAAWLIVQGVRMLPKAGDTLTAAVTAVTRVIHPAPEAASDSTSSPSTVIEKHDGTSVAGNAVLAPDDVPQPTTEAGAEDVPDMQRNEAGLDTASTQTYETAGAPLHQAVGSRTVVAPLAHGPADLAVAVVAVGVLAPVAGESTFFELSTIPSDHTAAVRFTVTNQGSVRSRAWAFVAELPLAYDHAYRYVSPAQDPLDPGMQVEFTMGFNDIVQNGSGTVNISIVPTDANDRADNNADAVTVSTL